MPFGTRFLLLSLTLALTQSSALAQPWVVECWPPIVVWQPCLPPIYRQPVCPVPLIPTTPVPMREQAEPQPAVPQSSSSESPKTSDSQLSPPKVEVIPNESIPYNPVPSKNTEIRPVEEATPQPARPEGVGGPSSSEQLSMPRSNTEETIPELQLKLPTSPGIDEMPPLQLETPGSREAKSSPLNVAPLPTIHLFPVAGTKPIAADATRIVGFFNHTDNDFALTVQGETITLPKHHYVKATVPTAFTWHLGKAANRQVNIPEASPGMEIVLRPTTDK